MKQHVQIFTLCFLFLLFAGTVAAEQYNIKLATNPEKIIARDNPFAHYDDLGPLPSLAVSVKDSAGISAKDVTITITITHVDNLLLPTGFPWIEGKELYSVTSDEENGILEITGLLFPLRGQYAVDVNVLDSTGNQQKKQFILDVAEPFKQSTLNAIIFIAALTIFGFIVGIVFGKDILLKKKAQSSLFVLLFVLSISLVASTFVLAHSEEEIGQSGIVHYEDSQVMFYTIPSHPDIGTPTTFIFEVNDENGMPVNNAVASIEIANEEEGFVVLETELFSQTGTFNFNYGIFDGAPHIVTVHVKPTEKSSTQFAAIERAYGFAAEAHNPPLSAKLIATTVMLVFMVFGFIIGVSVRRWCKKCSDIEGGSHD